jgi:hypothetical protein
MTTTTTSTTRVANHKIDNLFRELVPFSNYNASIVATLDFYGIYTVTHWGTEIARIDTTRRALGKDAVVSLNLRYYSQTTSTLQGKVVRSLLTRGEALSLLDWYQNQGDKEYFDRLRRLGHFPR